MNKGTFFIKETNSKLRELYRAVKRHDAQKHLPFHQERLAYLGKNWDALVESALELDLWLNRSLRSHSYSYTLHFHESHMKKIKDTYTATSKNFCSQWDRAIFSHKLISHKIINLKKQTVMKADKLKDWKKHTSAANSVQLKMQIYPWS